VADVGAETAPPAIASARKIQPQKWLFSVDAYEDDAVLSLPDPAGRPQRRLVELADVVAALRGANRDGEPKVRWFGLQAGVAAVGIAADGGQRWLVVRPAGPAEIQLDVGGKRQRMQLRLPALLGELEGRQDEKGQAWLGIGRVMCFQEKAGQLKPSTMLRACPLPNCYEDGRVCMGSVDQKLFRNLPPSAFFERAFIGSVFTDHAIAAPLAGAAEKRKYANIIQALRATGGRVPMKMLKEVGSYAKIYS
jgi:hypothetical protein